MLRGTHEVSLPLGVTVPEMFLPMALWWRCLGLVSLGFLSSCDVAHDQRPVFLGRPIDAWWADTSDPGQAEVARDAILGMGREAVPFLGKVIRSSPDDEQVLRATSLLWILGPLARGAESDVVAMMRRGDPGMTEIALQLFARIGPRDPARAEVRRAMAADDVLTRLLAARTVRRLRLGTAFREAIRIRLTQESSPGVRAELCWIVSREPGLYENEAIVAEVANLSQRAGGMESHLEAAVGTAFVLGRAGRSLGGIPATAELVPVAWRIAGSGVRREDLDVLRRSLESRRSDVARAAACIVRENALVCAELAPALARLILTETEALEPATEALIGMRGTGALAVARRLPERNELAAVLAVMGPAGAPALPFLDEAIVTASDRERRATLFWAIPYMGDAGHPYLRKYLESGDRDLVKEALSVVRILDEIPGPIRRVLEEIREKGETGDLRTLAAEALDVAVRRPRGR